MTNITMGDPVPDEVAPTPGPVGPPHRRGAGKSERSWEKHDLVNKLALARAGIMGAMTRGRYAIIDTTAGDGVGVATAQYVIGEEQASLDISRSTAQLALLLGLKAKRRADVFLCEIDRRKRASLEGVAETYQRKMPITILDDSARLLGHIRRGDYEAALVINDVCGPSQHNLEVLRHLSDSIPKSDFVVVSNEHFFARFTSPGTIARCESDDPTMPQALKTIWRRYGWQYTGPPFKASNYAEWMRRLNKRFCIFHEKTVVNSDTFRGRVMLYTNFLQPKHIPAGFLGGRL